MWYEETALHNALEKKSPPRNTLRSWFSTNLKMHLSLTISSDAHSCAYALAFRGCTRAQHTPEERADTGTTQLLRLQMQAAWEPSLLVAIPLLHTAWGDLSGRVSSASGWKSLDVYKDEMITLIEEISAESLPRLYSRENAFPPGYQLHCERGERVEPSAF